MTTPGSAYHIRVVIVIPGLAHHIRVVLVTPGSAYHIRLTHTMFSSSLVLSKESLKEKSQIQRSSGGIIEAEGHR